MADYIALGSVPVDEDCVGVSDKRPYMKEMTAECRRYKKLLEELFPRPNGVDAHFTIKSFPHDFGTYKEVCVVYDCDDEAACEYAYNVEANLPARWEGE